MNEENYRRWDIAVKIVGPVLTVAGILIGAWQFTTEQAAQMQRLHDQTVAGDKAEFKHRTWEKQAEVYSKISNIAGRIAASPDKSDKAKFNKEVNEFNNLYWGALIYVKDEKRSKRQRLIFISKSRISSRAEVMRID